MILPLQHSGVDKEQSAQWSQFLGGKGVDEGEISTADSLVRTGIENEFHLLEGMSWKDAAMTILNGVGHLAWKVLIAVAIFVAGRWLIRHTVKMMNEIFEKKKVDPALRNFVRGMVGILFYTVLFYLIIAWLGINTSLFVALFAAAGLAIGMAMSGIFQNFAGGVMILLLKPFKEGDWIETEGYAGTVTDIRLFGTVLLTADNRTILIPNGPLSTGIITDFNTAHTRRIDWTVPLDNNTDFDKLQKVLMEVVAAEKRVLKTPAPIVVINSIDPSSIGVIVRAWVKDTDYWDTLYAVNAAIYKAIPSHGFKFPSSTSVSLSGQITEVSVK